MKKRNRKGFTLVELVIVIAVIAILASVLIGTFASVIKRANQSAEVQNIKNAEIAQKADDIIKKIEESNWFGWEDFEAEIVKAVAEAAKSGQLSLDEIKPVVEDAVKTALANIKVENTGLTAEDVKAIVENAMGSLKYEGVTEAQVRAIVNGGTATLLGNQLTAAQVRTIVNTANEQNLTAVQLANVLSSQLSGVATLEALNAKMGDLQTAITGATANLATKEDVQTILDTIENFETTVNSADLDDVITAKALNIRIKNAGLTRANTPYDVVSAIEATDSELKSTILLSISQEQFGFFVIDDSYKLVNSCGLNISVDADNKVENAYKYWAFVSTYKTTDGFDYSQYLLGTGVTGTIDIDTGLDVGKNEGISTINYTSTTGHTVVIRTNGGTLTIDAENDTIKHYGTAHVVTLAAVSVNSYYENGEVKQVNIKKGRLVLTNNEDASVETIYLQATGDTYDNIILATQNGAELPSLITRDNVTKPSVGDTKKVVTIQTNVNEEGNSPEKTETINLYGTQGTSGNDVYEATNGYNVTALALLVVEASSTEAQEQAAQQISNPEVVAQVTESKTPVEVHDETELKSALASSAKYIIFANDISATSNVDIVSDVILDGKGYTLTTSEYQSSDARSINVGSTSSPIDVTLINLKVQGPRGGYSRGVNVLKAYVTLYIQNCEIYAGHYPINVVANGHHLKMDITDSTISGYCALNIWAFYNEISVSNSILTGTNNSSDSSSNFSTVCFESNTTFSDDTHSYNNKIKVNNTTINAIENNTCSQAIVGFNGGTIGAISCIFETNNCTFNSTNGKAYYDGGSANSWINDGVEMLPTVTVDLSDVSIESDGYTATGIAKFVINGKNVFLNLADAETSSWTSSKTGTTGMDYVFEYNAGLLTYTLDLDIWSGYSGGFALYLGSAFSD